MEGSFQLNPNASPFIPGSLSSFVDKAPEHQAESSSSKGDPSGDSSGDTFDPSMYEENYMDPLDLAKMVFSMFPNVSTDFIDELLKANDFDINLTVDMLHELSSQDMFHDDAEDINDLHDGKGLDDSYHHAEASGSSSNFNQYLQNEKSSTTSDEKSVLLKFSNINLLDKDLGLPDDKKSAGVSVGK